MLKKLNLLLLGILLLGIFLRFYQFGQIPAGITNDEADIGYDAYSILLTGKDQWGEVFPLTSFRGFGDHRPALYTYLVTPFISVFDLNSVSVRLPSAIAGALSILAIYFLAKKLFDRNTALFASLIFAVLPWSVGLSRLGIESNVAILFTLISLIFLTDFKTKSRNIFIGLFFLALTAYTYSAYFVFSFLVLGATLYFWRKEFFKLKKTGILAVLFFIVLISPLILNSLTAKTRLSQVGLTSNVTSIGVVQVLNDTRGHCQNTYPAVLCKLFNNKPVIFSEELVKNYISHFSPSLLYLTGTQSQFSILPSRGLAYIFEILFLVVGIAWIIKAKRREGYFVLALFLLSPIPDALTGTGNYSRASIMMPFLVLVEGIGLAYLFTKVIGIKQKSVRFGVLFAASCLFAFFVFSFFISYTSYFKNYYSRYSQHGYQELMGKVQENEDKYDKIYISRNINDAKQYIYYLFFNKYDPSNFQAKRNVEYRIEDGGWVDVSRIDNIYFVPNVSSIKITPELLDEKVMFFAHPSEFPDKINKVSDIKDLAGTTMFRQVDIKELSPFINLND